MQPFTIRPASAADLPTVNAIYYENEVDVSSPHAPPRRELPAFAHELETGTMLIAERAGEALGFTSAIRRGEMTYLAELFIRPERQSAGVGQALLRSVLPTEGVRCTMSSRDFRALGLYARAGMRPLWPNIWLRAQPEAIGELAVDSVEAVEARADDPELAAWDEEISGRRRPQDAAFWMRECRAVPVWLRRDGQTLGYAYIQMRASFSVWMPEASFIGPLGVRDAEDVAACVSAAVQWVRPRTTAVRLAVPGPNAALGPLVEAGFRIAYVETFCSSAAEPIFDPRRYLASGDAL